MLQTSVELKMKNKNMAITIEQLERFLKKHKLGLDAIDINDRLIYRFRPDKLNSKVDKQVLGILVHNNHAIKINKNLKRLLQKKVVAQEEKHIVTASDKYHIRKNDTKHVVVYINFLQDITNYCTMKVKMKIQLKRR